MRLRINTPKMQRLSRELYYGSTDVYRNQIRAELEPLRAAIAEPIEAALVAVNGTATAHTLTTWRDVDDVTDRAERRLDRSDVPQSARVGVIVRYTPAGPAAKAYKYGAVATSIEAMRTASGWWLTGVTRTTIRPRDPERFDIEVSPEARDAIIRHAMKGITVSEDA